MEARGLEGGQVTEKITAREFLIRYAENSKTTPEALFAEGVVVATCTHCDYEGCQGWQATTVRTMELFGKGDTIVLTAEDWAAGE